MSEFIKVTKLVSRQQMTSATGTFNKTTVVDEKGRYVSALGEWADTWVVGGSYEVNIEQKTHNGKIYLNAKNPHPQSSGAPRTYGKAKGTDNPVLISYQLAAALAPILFKDRKAPTLEIIDALALKLQERIGTKQETVVQTPVQEVIPEVKLDKEEPPAQEQVPEVEEDDLPF